MADLFLLEDVVHDADDRECGVCATGYPIPCVCGGLMHAAEVDEESEAIVSTKCGKCGRSEDDLEEGAA